MNDAVRFGLFVVGLLVVCKLFACGNMIRRQFRLYRMQRCTEQLAREAIPLIGLPWKCLQGPQWIAVSEAKHGFRVELKLMPQDAFLRIQADANFNVEPEFVSRQLLVFLLIMNAKFQMGNLGLSPTKDGYEIVHSHHCCAMGTPPQVVAAIGKNLVLQMEDCIDWLHANNMT